MKTTVSKKISSLVLAIAIAFSAVLSTAAPVQAATVKGVTAKVANIKGEAGLLLSETDEATAGVTKHYEVEVPATGTVYFDVGVIEVVGFQMKVTKAGQTVLDEYVAVDDSYWSVVEGVYFNGFYGTLDAGKYEIDLTFDSAAKFIIMVSTDAAAVKPVLNQTSATITAGFTKKLSVTDGKAKSWSSSNKKVATVDSKGKVTAKKKGNATITVKCTDGTTLKCKITVKANEYTARKITTSDVTYGESALSPYKISFDKKGNLVIKARYVNRMSHKVVELRNIKIVVKDANGKTVGTYKQSKKKVSVSSGSTKDFTFTIKKSSLKKKKADLRGGDVDVYGTSYYYVYY